MFFKMSISSGAGRCWSATDETGRPPVTPAIGQLRVQWRGLDDLHGHSLNNSKTRPPVKGEQSEVPTATRTQAGILYRLSG